MAVSSLQRLVGFGHWSGISLIQRVFFTWQLSLTPQEPLGNTSKSSLLFSPTCIQSLCPSLFQPEWLQELELPCQLLFRGFGVFQLLIFVCICERLRKPLLPDYTQQKGSRLTHHSYQTVLKPTLTSLTCHSCPLGKPTLTIFPVFL